MTVEDEDFDAWYADVRPPMVGALAVWCGDASLASDALDEAFVRAIERWERVRAMTSPGGWVWRTATNLVRRKARRRALEQRLLRRHAVTDAQQIAEPTADVVDLLAAVRQLPERQRAAVALYYIADRPAQEVAAAMDVAVGTVHATLHQARHRLGQLLGESVESSSATANLEQRDGELQ